MGAGAAFTPARRAARSVAVACSSTSGSDERRAARIAPIASLAAETGVAVFRVAFEQWVAGPGDRSLAETVRDSFEQLGAVVATG